MLRGFHPAGGVRVGGIGVAEADGVGTGDDAGKGASLAGGLGDGETVIATSAIGTRVTL
jgi:hypothetical protein